MRVFQHSDQRTYCHEMFYEYYAISTPYFSITCDNNNMADVAVVAMLSVTC